MGIYNNAYLRWKDDLNDAWADGTNAQAQHALFAPVYIDSFNDARTAHNYQVNINQFLINAIRHLSYFAVKADHERKLHSRLAWILDNEPWNGEDYELSWDKIIDAWNEANHDGQCQTIAKIDDMRMEIWNEPAIKYVLAR